MESIPARWRVLSGQDNWKNLLQPLDLDLRRYIINYGEKAQVTYDTFNSQTISKYAGSSKYPRSHLFQFVGLIKRNPFKYRVVRYLYATSKISVPDAFIMKSLSNDSLYKESNWMGYVAVATDEGKIALGRRDILIAWRGTVRPLEWVKDFDFPLVPASLLVGKHSDATVHKGVMSIYTSSDPQSIYTKASARDQVLHEVSRIVKKFKNEDISITIAGHSLGAALSTLSAADIVANGYNKTKELPEKICPVTVMAFGSPRVGDSNFRDVFQSMDHLHLLRIANAPDIVTRLPPAPYSDIGPELQINSLKSPYLKQPGNTWSFHDLEVYLHTVSGTQGPKGGFHLEVKRDISLVNKYVDALRDKYLIPTEWWCERNKGMVQQDDGSWELGDHDEK